MRKLKVLLPKPQRANHCPMSHPTKRECNRMILVCVNLQFSFEVTAAIVDLKLLTLQTFFLAAELIRVLVAVLHFACMLLSNRSMAPVVS